MRLIDADLLKGQMEPVCMGIMAGTESYGAPLKTIDNAPTVDPVKHGEWRCDEALELEWCSECGFGKRKGDKRWYSYCPNCGAKMDEVEDDKRGVE